MQNPFHIAFFRWALEAAIMHMHFDWSAGIRGVLVGSMYMREA